MALLHQHPRLWLKVAAEDRIVLHVAVMQGCVELVKQVLLLTPVENGTRQEFQKNLTKLLYAKDGKCRANAFQLAAIVGNKEVIQVLNSRLKPRSVLRASQNSTPYDHDHNDTSEVSLQIDVSSTHLHSPLEGATIELFKEPLRSKLHEALQKQMKGDVDFNFEEQRQGLIFNFACKNAHSNIDFLRNVAAKARGKPYLLQTLFTQMDAQGRTPLHVAVNHCRGVELRGVHELLDVIPDECVKGRDSAGRTCCCKLQQME